MDPFDGNTSQWPLLDRNDLDRHVIDRHVIDRHVIDRHVVERIIALGPNDVPNVNVIVKPRDQASVAPRRHLAARNRAPAAGVAVRDQFAQEPERQQLHRHDGEEHPGDERRTGADGRSTQAIDQHPDEEPAADEAAEQSDAAEEGETDGRCTW
ncbi:MAG: hypothetical protein IPH29_00995 [Candidatus Microthrix sp.]|nr:hypothetical protein [Candidatus Microthrix sp.]